MTSSGTRVGVLGATFGAGLCAVLLHLWLLMVQDQEVWARRSYENRWAFRSVPSQRGALYDRYGRLLAHDEPTTRVSIYYLRFRLRHVVGAAVHGAMAWADLQPGRQGTVYGYRQGVLGPVEAARDLLGMPVGVLRRGALSKAAARELMGAATTVRAGGSGLSRRRVYSALRESAEAGRGLGVGDVLPMPRSELLRAYDEHVGRLYELDRRFAAAQAQRAERLGLLADELPGLVETLEFLRRASRAEERVTWTDENGEPREGSLLENVRRGFAEEVPFEVAAALRADRDLYPGIEVDPSVRRVRAAQPETSLFVLLGRVLSLDRTFGDDDPRGRDWFDDHVRTELPDEWLDELVPRGLVEGDAARARLQESARRRYAYELMVRERRGVTGFEAAFDDALMGRLGLRFVEHDNEAREQVLWSHLRVESGDDVRLTIDADLQAAAEAAVRQAYGAWHRRHQREEDQKKVEAAIAVVDAWTGDLLAYAGAPIVSGNARDVPGVVWAGNATIGSIAKPFVLLEHLESERLGRPHRPLGQLAPCAGSFDHAGRRLRCDHEHWGEGQDPVSALAKSCNLFFYQTGLGVGEDGLERALRRFGLLPPADRDDPFAACWQPWIAGLAAARPRMDAVNFLLPQRAIGYGVEVSPVHMARAYAALATGSLPEVGLRLGAARQHVPLGDLHGSLELVREGLRRCVTSGTARQLELLAELGVHGKTGTAQVADGGENNAWFAGYLPHAGRGGSQLAFCAVVDFVPDGVHGADAGGEIVVDLLERVRVDRATLGPRYLAPEGGR